MLKPFLFTGTVFFMEMKTNYFFLWVIVLEV